MSLEVVFLYYSFQVLNISHNVILELTKYTIEDLLQLKHFDISSNNLTSIPNDLFEFIKKIEYFNVSRNQLDDIGHNTFKDMIRLTSLDLSFNHLSNDGFLWPITSLKYLNLSNNDYNRINVSILSNLIYAEMFDNSFDCQWLVHELAHTSTEGTIKFGRNYVVPHRKGVLKVPGIQCNDVDGTKRNIILLDPERAKEEFVTVSERE